MEVRFFLTSEDVWNFTKYGLSRPRLLLPLSILLLIILGLVFLTSFLNPISADPSNIFFNLFPFVIILFILAWIVFRARSRTRSTLRIDPTLQGEHIITISPENFRHKTNLTDTVISWRAFKEIAADKHNIYFLYQSRQIRGHIVPQRAFASPQDAETFLAWARTYCANGQAALPPRPAEPGPTYEHWS